MALKYSTGIRNFLQRDGSMKRALENGELKIFSGTVAADADAAVTGTLLATVTLSSGARTAEVLAAGSVTLTSGTAGQIDALTVNTVGIMGPVAVPFNTTLTQTATDLAAAINKAISQPGYTATSSGAVVTISALPLTGVGPNGFVVAITTSGGIIATSANMAGGVVAVNGLTYGDVAAGALSKTGIWSGLVATTGTASYFRILGSIADAGGVSTTLLRLQGTIATSGADYNMSSTSLTSGATHTIDTFTITLPATG